jgi:erythromycin esterase-like protein
MATHGGRPDVDAAAIEAVAHAATHVVGSLGDYDRLLALIGDARVVLLGAATHGSEEFYRERALITRRLIAEKGFTGVAVEADWPDAYRANRYVRGMSSDESGLDALGSFARFPSWVWRNQAVYEFLEWLREFNEAYHEAWSAVGFYGLDLYSVYTSIQEAIAVLESLDPEAARRAVERYGRLGRARIGERPIESPEAKEIADSYEEPVVEQLVELMHNRSRYLAEDEVLAEDEFFLAEQNARLEPGAEAYYRTLYRGGVPSWNLRDWHLMDTLQALTRHLTSRHEDVRLVVWAHSSHLADARYSSLGRQGEWNLGQLVREEYGDAAFLIGFTTWCGEVTAAADWNAAAQRMPVRPALLGSYEDLFHRAGLGRFTLPIRGGEDALATLGRERLERMIGVVYRPSAEAGSEYVACDLVRQLDAVVHLDVTTALEPVDTVGVGLR